MRRTPQDVRARVTELDERTMRGEATEDEVEESLRLVWPAYFARPEDAPPAPSIPLAVECFVETCASMAESLPHLEAALPGIMVPVGFLTGEGSPIPQTASSDSAARIPDAWVEAVPDAGHFVWLDRPGSVQAALQRLSSG